MAVNSFSSIDRRDLFRLFGAGSASLATASLFGVEFALASGSNAVIHIKERLRRRRRRGGGGEPTGDATIQQFKEMRRSRRGLGPDELDKLYGVTLRKPRIDFQIYFPFNSADITDKAYSKLRDIGEALSDVEFDGQDILIAGHTDRKGTASYNKRLSEMRADAIASHLVRNFDIDASRLFTVGYGYSKLSVPSLPYSSKNRRVEFVNLSG